MSPSQRELLLNSGVGFVEYEAITIRLIDFTISKPHDNLIFTSQNAVKSYTKKENSEKRSKISAFCVGEKTKSMLEDLGFTVISNAQNAEELAKNIVALHKNKAFLFLSGNKRRDELPNILKKNNVRYSEVVIYETTLNPKKFERRFDGVLFFSPSGVESFVVENNLRDTIAFCIGATTASEAKKYTNKIILANKQTIENVIVKAVKHLSAHYQGDVTPLSAKGGLSPRGDN